MGVGMGIGGSIRIPAAYCGFYGQKDLVACLRHSGFLGSHDGMGVVIGAGTDIGGSMEPKSFLHDADDDHMTPTGDFTHEDMQQEVGTYGLEEM